MGDRVAIIAGRGALVHEVAQVLDAPLFVTFDEVDGVVVPEDARLRLSFSQLGTVFDSLRAHHISKVVFAGALARPNVDVTKMDAKTAAIMPRFLRALEMGDDGLLREVIALFEDEGFEILGAHEVAPGLIMRPDLVQGPKPDPQQESDVARGFEVLAAIAPLDIAQAIVIERAQVLGIETLQGTDALLAFVAGTRPELRRSRGILVKTAKAGQDPRIDMPTIGPATILGVAKAGLAGIAVQPGAVLVLEQGEVARLLEANNLFLVVG